MSGFNFASGYRLTTDCKDLWIHPHPTLRTLHPDVLGLPQRGHSFTLYTMRKHVGTSPSLQGGPSFLLHPTTQRHWLAPTFLKGEESLGISPFRIDLLDRKALATHREHNVRLRVTATQSPPQAPPRFSECRGHPRKLGSGNNCNPAS